MVNDKLNIIFSKQKEFDENLPSPNKINVIPLDEKINAKCQAIIHEAIELQRLTNWKWWKDPHDFNKEEAKEELIDIMFFVVSAAIDMGMTPEDFFQEYLKKYIINIQRQTKRITTSHSLPTTIYTNMLNNEEITRRELDKEIIS